MSNLGTMVIKQMSYLFSCVTATGAELLLPFLVTGAVYLFPGTEYSFPGVEYPPPEPPTS